MSSKSKKYEAYKRAFKSAKSSGEMIKSLKVLETCSDENELGLECWKLAEKILEEEGDLEQVLSYGKRALSIFITNDNASLPCFGGTPHARGCHGPPLFIGQILHLLGSTCLRLNRYHESLSYLNWSQRNLDKLKDEDDNCPDKCVLHSLCATELELFEVKLAMGKREEAAPHMLKILEIKEVFMEEGSLGLGKACKDVYEAYLAIIHFTDALPFCLRASEIYLKHFGDDSLEVAQIRRNLGVIYNGIGEYEKALEQNQLALNVFKTVGESSEIWKWETESGCMLIQLGRNEEAIDVLKSVISRGDVDEPGLSMAYITMAKAFGKLNNFAGARKYMKLGCKILEKKGAKAIFVACGFADVSDICMMMKDYETGITVTRKVLGLTELPQQIIRQASDRLFKLIYLSGKMGQRMPYLEDAVEKLEDKFGPEHYVVGDGHLKLAVALKDSGRLESSAKHFIIAKDILDVTVGPNHLQTLLTGQLLSRTYAQMGRYRQAIEYQTKVVEGFEGLGQSEKLEEILKRATRLLEEMKLGDKGTDPEK